MTGFQPFWWESVQTVSRLTFNLFLVWQREEEDEDEGGDEDEEDEDVSEEEPGGGGGAAEAEQLREKKRGETSATHLFIIVRVQSDSEKLKQEKLYRQSDGSLSSLLGQIFYRSWVWRRLRKRKIPGTLRFKENVFIPHL